MIGTEPVHETTVNSERFELLHCLGSGAFGVVYHAYDRMREATVALKILRNTTADTLYRFKQEFRLLANTNHPNLVSLYELLFDGEHWFFTMELVEGEHFLQYIGDESGTSLSYANHSTSLRSVQPITPRERMSVEEATTLASISRLSSEGGSTIVDNARERFLSMASGIVVPAMHTENHATKIPMDLTGAGELPPCRANIPRLRVALGQVVRGIFALHQVGIIHRDIKGANIVLTEDGRAVILDFGLVAILSSHEVTVNRNFVGTPQYMAPEYGTGQPATEACDWYSVGVLLFRALTGRFPFVGADNFDTLRLKKLSDALPPAAIVGGVPDDLNDLCVRLLRRVPELRPTGEQLCHELRLNEGARPYRLVTSGTDAVPLVGRRSYIEYVIELFRRLSSGTPVMLYVSGPTGVGKTALLRWFMGWIAATEPNVVTLVGRSYLRESVPFKGLDSLVDDLCQYLRKLNRQLVAELLPEDMLTLVKLFPVLLQVGVIAEMQRDSPPAPPPGLLDGDLDEAGDGADRRHALMVLSELLARMATRSKVMILLDDLQWGDSATLELLEMLMRPPNPPALMIVACYRSEDLENSEILQRLLPLRMSVDAAVEVAEMGVTPLKSAEAVQLASDCLKDYSPIGRRRAKAIARESEGIPGLIQELAQYAKAGDEGHRLDPQSAFSLERAVMDRLNGLSADARRMLDILVVSQQPLTPEALKAIGELSDEITPMKELHAASFARTRGSGETLVIEVFNDRVRGSIHPEVDDAARQSIHLRLAEWYELAGDSEAAMLSYRAAGEREKMLRHAIVSGREANRRGAPEQAAAHFLIALDSVRGEDKLNAADWRDLARASALRSDYYRSAELFVNAIDADRESPVTPNNLCDAARYFLLSGHLAEGLGLTQDLFGRIGLTYPRAQEMNTLQQWTGRFLTAKAMRAVSSQRQISDAERLRVDACWSVSYVLLFLAPTHGAVMQHLHIKTALECGRPFEVMRALVLDAAYHALQPAAKAKRVEELLEVGRSALEGMDDQDYPLGWYHLVAALCHAHLGEIELAERECELATPSLREGCAWERAVLMVVGFVAQMHRGQIKECIRDWADYNEQGYFGAEISRAIRFLSGGSTGVLLRDDPQLARAALSEIAVLWEPIGAIQHWVTLRHCEVDLYLGEFEQAWLRLQEKTEPSGLLRPQWLEMSARCSLAVARIAEAQEDQELLIRAALHWAKQLRAYKRAPLNALATVISAGAEFVRRGFTAASPALSKMEEAIERQGMALYLSAFRLRYGQCTGGDRGRFHAVSGSSWMREQGIVKPRGVASMLLPWFVPDARVER